MTFTSYLRECRLNWAAHLLETTRFSIQKIAYEVGYTDERYFAELFNKTYRASPSEYRAKIVQKGEMLTKNNGESPFGGI